MNNLLVMFTFGLVLFVLGILLKKREVKLFENSVVTVAKVVTYYDYRDPDSNLTMYTMAIEYNLPDGTKIHAKEKSSSNGKKYPIGTELEIYYRKEKPDFFIVQGDNSRKIIFIGMMIVGLILMGLFGFMLIRG